MRFPDERHELCSIILFILSISSTLLNAVSLATPRWIYSETAIIEYGLFESCTMGTNLENCEAIQHVPHSLNATRAFMILGSLLMVVALPISGIHACGKLRRGHAITAILFTAACILLLIACSIFTARSTELQLESSKLGYSLWMAWASCITTFVAIPLSILSKDRSIA